MKRAASGMLRTKRQNPRQARVLIGSKLIVYLLVYHVFPQHP
jgi:hypothetical protein